ncbi:MAG TPA: protein-L-isoaspartate(D-aspartate) O-methyltransferase [Gemmatimonadales bacterium]|nr:protein-L-isoaspartate(D-aspartate) O-methyltransferase [Gemmatimonadales bacterium]
MEAGRVADTYAGYRARLVERLREQGIRDLAVLRAFGETPRHLFVPEALRERAYEDTALPIGRGQTISRPLTHANHLQALSLQGKERVLEVGTGSGYQAALLSQLVAQVFTVERFAQLADRAREGLAQAGVRNVTVLVGDGSLGWRPYAPYDAILVSAAAPSVPQPLLDQLGDGGRLLVPLGGADAQELIRITRRGSTFNDERLSAASFVPLVGRHGTNDAR